jgi:hypothetical protein
MRSPSFRVNPGVVEVRCDDDDVDVFMPTGIGCDYHARPAIDRIDLDVMAICRRCRRSGCCARVLEQRTEPKDAITLVWFGSFLQSGSDTEHGSPSSGRTVEQGMTSKS